ncbi:cell division protein [Bifidobacterium goeldii]|uniref:Cell division protein n=1 Tax=Bifidobacterium goeldii TaxID=2306975 RepID=A0A430FN51_9BIFI|nr:penicillin-binding protein 2 [Bifidobacterium goeldii]RSX54262.1 cell division protein [Bifidobacterium goeldii]
MIKAITSLVKFAKARRFAAECIAIGVVLALIASSCMIKLASIQLIDGQTTAQAATDARTRKVTVKAMRGRITDTNGTVLAQSVERYTIIGDPYLASTFEPINCGTKQAEKAGFCHKVNGKRVGAKGAAAIARLLAPVLGLDSMELGAKLTGTNRYVVIKKDVEPAVKRAIDNLHLGGIVYGTLSSQRVYANGTQLGALLGGVDDSNTGVAGIEQMENSALNGTDGYVVYQQGNGGEEIPGTMTDSKDAVNGSDVALTIDHDVDWYVKKALKEGKEKSGAAWGIAVVQKVGSGEILALEDTDEYEAGSDDAKLNTARAVSQTFEPGSVGKVITMAGLLQTGLHKATDKFTVPYSYTKNGQEYHDSSSHGDEHWTLAGIIKNSSNVGVVMASAQYTNEQRYEFLTKFGVGQSSGLNIPGESQGVLRSPEAWDGRTSNTVLFGQGYTTNAIQLTNVVATIANKGVRNQQSLIKSITHADGTVETPTSGSATRVVDEQVASDVKNAMESVAESYDKLVHVDGYRIAAKTGTAEVAGADGRLTSIVADFTGMIPADNPQYVITVVLKDPAGTYGGVTAGPIFAQIGEFLMQKYDVPVSSPRNDAIAVDW